MTDHNNSTIELRRVDIKRGAKALAKVLKEKYQVDLKHGHALDVISQLLGYRDWNTLSGMAKRNPEKSCEHSDSTENGFCIDCGDYVERYRA